jgi:hypothetical protein
LSLLHRCRIPKYFHTNFLIHTLNALLLLNE